MVLLWFLTGADLSCSLYMYSCIYVRVSCKIFNSPIYTAESLAELSSLEENVGFSNPAYEMLDSHSDTNKQGNEETLYETISAA